MFEVGILLLVFVIGMAGCRLAIDTFTGLNNDTFLLSLLTIFAVACVLLTLAYRL